MKNADDDLTTVSSEVLYEVSIAVDAQVEGEYMLWLRSHIGDMLQLPGFLRANLWKQVGGGGDVLRGDVDVVAKGINKTDGSNVSNVGSGVRRIVVHYVLRDKASLETYFEVYASRMRSEVPELLQGRFRIERRQLALREEFDL